VEVGFAVIVVLTVGETDQGVVVASLAENAVAQLGRDVGSDRELGAHAADAFRVLPARDQAARGLISRSRYGPRTG
jgi:hypothetical protein